MLVVFSTKHPDFHMITTVNPYQWRLWRNDRALNCLTTGPVFLIHHLYPRILRPDIIRSHFVYSHSPWWAISVLSLIQQPMLTTSTNCMTIKTRLYTRYCRLRSGEDWNESQDCENLLLDTADHWAVIRWVAAQRQVQVLELLHQSIHPECHYRSQHQTVSLKSLRMISTVHESSLPQRFGVG